MKPLSLFMPYIAPWLPGAPEPLIEQTLIQKAIEFCEQTHVVQQTYEKTSVALRPNYDLELPSGTRVVAVERAAYLRRPLNAVSVSEAFLPEAVRDTEISGAAERVIGEPTDVYFKAPGHDEFFLYPVPRDSITSAIYVRLSLKPNNDATALPSALFDDWAAAMRDGVCAELMAMKGQQFTSANALVFEKAYRGAVATARIEARRGRVQTSMQVRPVLFAPRRGA